VKKLSRCELCFNYNYVDPESNLCPFCLSIQKELEANGKIPFHLKLARFQSRLSPAKRLLFGIALIVPLFCLLGMLAAVWLPLVTLNSEKVFEALLFGVLFGAVSGLLVVLIFWSRWYFVFYRKAMSQFKNRN
jgi:hypothetical protein